MVKRLPSPRSAGHGWGAISIVNAIPSGIGCSAAIKLCARAEISLRDHPKNGAGITWASGGPSRFLAKVIELALDRAHTSVKPRGWSVSILSSIPPSKGLKSSSAVSVALARAVYSAIGKQTDEETLASISSEAAITTGVSVTGAFDDALTSASGGVNIADVRNRTSLGRGVMGAGLSAVLWVPDQVHATPGEIRSRLGGSTKMSRMAAELALKGEYLKAMEVNSEAVESALGYDYSEVRRAGKEAGAIASGVSGNGPALAFVVKTNESDRVASAIKMGKAKVLEVDFAGPGDLPL